MGDRSLDDFLDGDDGGDDAEASPDRPGEAADDDPTDSEADDRAEVETGADDEIERGDEREGDETEASDAADTADDDGVRVDPTTVDPAEAIYAWSADGDTCADCGETVERRWRSEDGLVCPGCKDW